LFYLGASPDIGDGLYLIGNELNVIQGYLRRLDSLFPDAIQHIKSEYGAFFNALSTHPELKNIIHPIALNLLTDPSQYMDYLTHPAMMYSGTFMAAHYGHITGVSFPENSHVSKPQIMEATHKWLTKDIYGRTKLPLNGDGTR
jgi:hypothetical protein